MRSADDRSMCADAGPVDLDQLGLLIDQARAAALAYRNLTGRPLGITGEVGEYEAIRLLGLTLAPVRSPGFDATDSNGRTYQVKARCVLNKRSQRIGAIKTETAWDAVLLVLLDETLAATAIWEADREAVVAALRKPGSKARNERGTLAVSTFQAIGRQVWPAITQGGVGQVPPRR